MAGHSVRFAVALFIAGSLLRLTVRDGIPFISAIFYGTPLVILVVLGLYGALGLAISRRYAWAAAAVVASMAWATAWSFTQFSQNEFVETPEDHSVLLWNLQNGASGWEGAFQWILDKEPDIAGLVESHNGGWSLQFDKDLPSGYESTSSRRGLTIFARGTVDETEEGKLGRYGWYLSSRVTVDGDSFRVIVVDLLSFPFISRRPAIEELRKIADRYIDEPLLIMGDFNTPYDSVHFDLLSTDMTHAFRAHGAGYAPTWPLPIPMMELDHVWFNDRISAASCRHSQSRNSDHRAVELRCQITP